MDSDTFKFLHNTFVITAVFGFAYAALSGCYFYTGSNNVVKIISVVLCFGFLAGAVLSLYMIIFIKRKWRIDGTKQLIKEGGNATDANEDPIASSITASDVETGDVEEHRVTDV